MALSNRQFMGIGCLGELAVFIVGMFALGDLDSQASAIAYLILLVGPYFLVRWALKRFELWPPVVGAVAGPAFVVLCFLLGRFATIETEGKEGNKVPVSGEVIAQKAAEKIASKDSGGKAVLEKQTNMSARVQMETPPGVRYEPEDANPMRLDDALAELDGLIGLKPVKEEVRKIVNTQRLNRLRREQGLTAETPMLHMVFYGNPGTGKTTVARIVAKIFRALGVLKRGHLVETDRGGLVAGYSGQTAIKTGKVIDFAMDGVLFIDEAYALMEGPQDNYGSEAIATLLKRMEDDRDRLVVIVAGYAKEMKQFFQANSGMESRLPQRIDFPDYTAEELAAMFRMRAKKKQYKLSPELDKWLDGYIAQIVQKRSKNFGNGRWVRTLFENAVKNCATRLASVENPTLEQLQTLELQDVNPGR